MRLEEVQELAPSVAPLLGLQFVQQPIGRVGPEEGENGAQEVVALRPLRQLADPLLGQVLVAGDDHRLDEGGLDLPFLDHLAREVEHLQRPAVRALVELLDGGVDHLAEAPAGLGRLVGERDHPAHRTHLAALGEGGSVGGRGEGPARHAAAQRPEHLVGPGHDAELADALEVLLQLRPVLRLEGGLEHRIRHQRGAPRGEVRLRRAPCGPRRFLRRARRVSRGRGRPGQGELLEPPQQQRQAAQPLHDGREHLGCGLGGLLRARRGRARDGLRGAGLAVDDLHLRGERLAGLVQPGEPERERLALLRGAGLQQQGSEGAEVGVERGRRDQPEVAHHVDLARGVEEQVADRQRALLDLDLSHGPRRDLPGDEGRRQLHEQGQRVQGHQRGDLVRQVLPQHVESVLELGGNGAVSFVAHHAVSGSTQEAAQPREVPGRPDADFIIQGSARGSSRRGRCGGSGLREHLLVGGEARGVEREALAQLAHVALHLGELGLVLDRVRARAR